MGMRLFDPNYRLTRPTPLVLPQNLNSPGVFTPVGTVMPWRTGNNRLSAKIAQKETPENWMKPLGQSLGILRYWKLFRKLGFKYGRKGLKFCLPNLKGTINVKVPPTQKYRNDTGGFVYFTYVIKVR